MPIIIPTPKERSLFFSTNVNGETIGTLSKSIIEIKSLKSNQFVIKFDSNNDLRLQNEDRDDLIFFILNRFANQCPDLNMKVYGIPKPDLSSYCIYDKAVIKAQMKAG